MRANPKIVVDEEGRSAVATLATGEKVHISFTSSIGGDGFGLRLVGEFKGPMLLIPSGAQNSAVVRTQKSMADDEASAREVAANRKPQQR